MRRPAKAQWSLTALYPQTSRSDESVSSEIAELIGALHLDADSVQTILDIAEEAASQFAEEGEGAAWIELQVRRRHPDLWLKIRARALGGRRLH